MILYLFIDNDDNAWTQDSVTRADHDAYLNDFVRIFKIEEGKVFVQVSVTNEPDWSEVERGR